LLQQLIGNLDRDLQYAIAVEGKLDIDSVTNYDEVKDAIEQKVLDIAQEDTLIFTLSPGYQMAN
jgi:DNA polymerase epsilon subunit 1